MSKKNLARTAIEGGRANSNKWDRRNSHTQERRSARDFCNKAKIDPEITNEESVESKDKVYKEFTDKLSPMYRWLKSKVGEPWDEVRSEVFKKFDSRTTAGRHILFDHLLSSVVDTQTGFNKYGYIVDPDIEIANNNNSDSYYYRRAYQDYYVNQDGILCESIKDRIKYEKITEADYRTAGKWLNGRMIVNRGGVLFWCCPTDGIWMASWIKPDKLFDHFGNKLKYYLFDNGLYTLTTFIGWEGSPKFTGRTHGDHWELIENPFSFRQRGPLSEEELKQFKSLKKRFQKEILEFSKGR
jgi:hypothetical protein